MMLAELETLLGRFPPQTPKVEFQTAILQDNILGKKTASARKNPADKLVLLYALEPKVTLYRLLRLLWSAEPDGRPLLAFLCASARDPVLRCTAETVLTMPIGAVLSKERLAETLQTFSQTPLASTTLASMVRNVSSSWTQSGHLKGKTGKMRSSPNATVGAAAYALVMGYLCGARGQFLFTTLWARMLDKPEPLLRELAQKASQRGWLRYRSIGDVTDITFDEILTPEERGALHEPS